LAIKPRSSGSSLPVDGVVWPCDLHRSAGLPTNRFTTTSLRSECELRRSASASRLRTRRSSRCGTPCRGTPHTDGACSRGPYTETERRSARNSGRQNQPLEATEYRASPARSAFQSHRTSGKGRGIFRAAGHPALFRRKQNKALQRTEYRRSVLRWPYSDSRSQPNYSKSFGTPSHPIYGHTFLYFAPTHPSFSRTSLLPQRGHLLPTIISSVPATAVRSRGALCLRCIISATREQHTLRKTQ